MLSPKVPLISGRSRDRWETMSGDSPLAGSEREAWWWRRGSESERSLAVSSTVSSQGQSVILPSDSASVAAERTCDLSQAQTSYAAAQTEVMNPPALLLYVASARRPTWRNQMQAARFPHSLLSCVLSCWYYPHGRTCSKRWMTWTGTGGRRMGRSGPWSRPAQLPLGGSRPCYWQC
eukprot:3122410-Rhodomonas_salina.2